MSYIMLKSLLNGVLIFLLLILQMKLKFYIVRKMVNYSYMVMVNHFQNMVCILCKGGHMAKILSYLQLTKLNVGLKISLPLMSMKKFLTKLASNEYSSAEDVIEEIVTKNFQ